MKIDTLEFIHSLLRTEVMRANEAHRVARKLQHEYEDKTDEETCRLQGEAADRYWGSLKCARSALDDFENQEW